MPAIVRIGRSALLLCGQRGYFSNVFRAWYFFLKSIVWISLSHLLAVLFGWEERGGGVTRTFTS